MKLNNRLSTTKLSLQCCFHFHQYLESASCLTLTSLVSSTFVFSLVCTLFLLYVLFVTLVVIYPVKAFKLEVTVHCSLHAGPRTWYYVQWTNTSYFIVGFVVEVHGVHIHTTSDHPRSTGGQPVHRLTQHLPLCSALVDHVFSVEVTGPGVVTETIGNVSPLGFHGPIVSPPVKLKHIPTHRPRGTYGGVRSRYINILSL